MAKKAESTSKSDIPCLPESLLGKIHSGDCISGMNGLPAETIDLVFADPPFNIGYEYDVYQDSQDSGKYLEWSRQWIGAVYRALKPHGTFWLAIGDEYAAELKIESQRIGFHARSWVIWYYTFGVNCKTKFSRSHAHLFHFVKDPQRCTFRWQELENRIPSARQLVYDDARANPNGRLPDDTWILRPQDLVDRFNPDEDTWYFPRVAGTFTERAGFHGCQMPEQLLGRIIRTCSHPGDIVLDPFSGSATTLAVAKKLGRRFLGFELSPDYVKRGMDRLQAIRVGDRLEGSPEPTMSAPATRTKTPSRPNVTPLDRITSESEAAQDNKALAEFDTSVVQAFTRVCDGFSVERVIADPELNAALAHECRKAGLPGDRRWWNRRLLGLRKAGRLAQIRTDRRTVFSWEDCDAFFMASEIAWQEMLKRGYGSLDDILCDPDAAAEFDEIARRWVPGFQSLQYRWGALKLRKASKAARTRAALVERHRFHELLSEPLSLESLNVASLPEAAGVYMVVDERKGSPLYAGEALRLQIRIKEQVERRTWDAFTSRPAIRYLKAEPDYPLLLSYRFLCVKEYNPGLNLESTIA